MIRHIPLLTALALVASGAGNAHEYKQGSISIIHPWARPTAEGAKVGAAYVSLQNNANEADILVSVDSPVSEKTQVHETRQDGDVMKMRPVEGGVKLSPGATVAFRPGGYHIMLIGLKQKLDDGQRIPLIFIFAKAGSIKVEAEVEKAASGQQKSDTTHSHNMSGMDHSIHMH